MARLRKCSCPQGGFDALCERHGLPVRDPSLIPMARQARRKNRSASRSMARESDPQVIRQAYIDGVQDARLAAQERDWREGLADHPFWCEADPEEGFQSYEDALGALVMHHAGRRRDEGIGYRDRGEAGVDWAGDLEMLCSRHHRERDQNLS